MNLGSVPNANSTTCTFPSNNGATYDMQPANNVRYVNAENVYSYGYGVAQGVTWDESMRFNGLNIFVMSSQSIAQIIFAAKSVTTTATIEIHTVNAAGTEVRSIILVNVGDTFVPNSDEKSISVMGLAQGAVYTITIKRQAKQLR